MQQFSKEENARNRRRRARQIMGVGILALVLIGIYTVFGSVVALVETLTDDTEKREEYANRLAGLVMFDPLPFQGAENIQDTTVRSAAVWGTLSEVLLTETGIANYSRDPVTDQVLLPAVEVEAYLSKIFGPDFEFTHKTFEMEGMVIKYDETLLSYYIPVTSMIGSYIPVVEKLFKEDGKQYATVGYIPTENSNNMVATNQEQSPVKYMDYVFEKTGDNWYLTGVVESETVAQVKPNSVPASQVTLPPLEDFETEVLENFAESEKTNNENESTTNENTSSETTEASSETDLNSNSET